MIQKRATKMFNMHESKWCESLTYEFSSNKMRTIAIMPKGHCGISILINIY